MRRGKTRTLGLMETQRFAKLEIVLILAAPGLIALCVLWWLAFEGFYARVGATGLSEVSPYLPTIGSRPCGA